MSTVHTGGGEGGEQSENAGMKMHIFSQASKHSAEGGGCLAGGKFYQLSEGAKDKRCKGKTKRGARMILHRSELGLVS